MSEIVLDSSLRSVLHAMGDLPDIDLDALPLEEALKIARASRPPAPRPATAEDRSISGFNGAKIRLRLYYPDRTVNNRPIVLHFHGGGFVGGSIELDDARNQYLAREANCIVASVGYRLAPECRFPVAIEDGLCAWNWICLNAGEIGGDAERLAISGSSAGGHIAVGVTLMTRKRSLRRPLLQLLTYPVLDPGMNSPSYDQFARGPFLTKARMAWYWKQYAEGGAVFDSKTWEPLNAEMAGLPPAFIITAEYDVLRDEGEQYAARLQDAGVEATVERHRGMIHGFLTVVPDHVATKEALQSCAAALRQRLA